MLFRNGVVEHVTDRDFTVAHSGLNLVDYAWPLDEKLCPCDLQFLKWIDGNSIRNAAIFHFGTGAHHFVGIENAKASRKNSVYGVTASVAEHDAYEKLIIETPQTLRYYQVFFCDAYMLNEQLLPLFDVISLFHLCEFRDERSDAYGAYTDLELLMMLTRKAKPGARILFYEGSNGFKRTDGNTNDVLRAWEERCDVQRVGTFESLLVYTVRASRTVPSPELTA